MQALWVPSMFSSMLPAVLARRSAERLQCVLTQVFMSQLAQTDSAGSLPPVLHVPLMNKAEEQLVVVEFNQTQKAYDPDKFVHSMFVEHVRRNPQAPCVNFEGSVYSYAEVSWHPIGLLAVQQLLVQVWGPCVCLPACTISLMHWWLFAAA